MASLSFVQNDEWSHESRSN